MVEEKLPVNEEIKKTGGNVSYPTQLVAATQNLMSILKILSDSGKTLSLLRRKFRGEALVENNDGSSIWIQISRPMFLLVDVETEKPIKKKIEMPDGEIREVFVPNDEAIENVLAMLEFMGFNQITPITNISEDIFLDDLREFECKLAGILALKQKSWGLDKELLPMEQMKIKTLIQDVRAMPINGGTLKAIQTNVQRIEQLIEGDRAQKKQLGSSPYQ